MQRFDIFIIFHLYSRTVNIDSATLHRTAYRSFSRSAMAINLDVLTATTLLYIYTLPRSARGRLAKCRARCVKVATTSIAPSCYQDNQSCYAKWFFSKLHRSYFNSATLIIHFLSLHRIICIRSTQV